MDNIKKHLKNDLKNYFNGFEQLKEFKTKTSGEKAQLIAKVSSYFTIIAPLLFTGAVLGYRGGQYLKDKIDRRFFPYESLDKIHDKKGLDTVVRKVGAAAAKALKIITKAFTGSTDDDKDKIEAFIKVQDTDKKVVGVLEFDQDNTNQCYKYSRDGKELKSFSFKEYHWEEFKIQIGTQQCSFRGVVKTENPKDDEVYAYGQLSIENEDSHESQRYVGEFLNRQMDGDGIVVLPNGQLIDVKFKNGTRI